MRKRWKTSKSIWDDERSRGEIRWFGFVFHPSPALWPHDGALPSRRERVWLPVGGGEVEMERGMKGKGEKDRRWGRWKIQFYLGYKRIIISTKTGGGRKVCPWLLAEPQVSETRRPWWRCRKSFHQNSFKTDQKQSLCRNKLLSTRDISTYIIMSQLPNDRCILKGVFLWYIFVA